MWRGVKRFFRYPMLCYAGSADLLRWWRLASRAHWKQLSYACIWVCLSCTYSLITQRRMGSPMQSCLFPLTSLTLICGNWNFKTPSVFIRQALASWFVSSIIRLDALSNPYLGASLGLDALQHDETGLWNLPANSLMRRLIVPLIMCWGVAHCVGDIWSVLELELIVIGIRLSVDRG